MTVRVRAYAKINLSLRVVGRREDGYHEILSDVQTVNLSDRLEIDVGGDRVRVDNDLAMQGTDIAERAAIALLAAKDRRGGARIRVRKGIPAGAGLGGGSSDAAAVLGVLDRLTPPVLPIESLYSIGAQIGSDVPLFLHGGRLLMRGRGEHLTRVPASVAACFVIVVPPVHCDTQAVYARWDILDDSRGDGRHVEAALGENDLLRPALSVHPELVPYHDAVASLEAMYCGMSGSGSSFYAAFDERASAERARLDLARRFDLAEVFVCRPTDLGHREEAT